MDEPDDELILISYDLGGGSFNTNVNVLLSDTIAAIEAAISIALVNAGITFTDVFVTRTDTGGGLYAYFIEVLNSSAVLTVASYGDGFDTGWVLTFCDTTPPIEATNLELREDGSIELREDLFFEIRE